MLWQKTLLAKFKCRKKAFEDDFVNLQGKILDLLLYKIKEQNKCLENSLKKFQYEFEQKGADLKDIRIKIITFKISLSDKKHEEELSKTYQYVDIYILTDLHLAIQNIQRGEIFRMFGMKQILIKASFLIVIC